MIPKEKNRLFCYILFPAAGTLFLLWYIYAAGADVVYSDYIRIINDYLPDVDNAGKFFVPDILTRIPLAYIQRMVNVREFSYSVIFDRLFTCLGIFLMALALLRFAFRQNLKIWAYGAVMIILFSLSKWEVLMNGTCWAHMVSIGLFFINFIVLDDIWHGESTGLSELFAYLMPFLWLLIAGEYIASYAVTVILAASFGALTGGAVNHGSKRVQRVFVRIIIATALALFLYLLSRRSAVWEHSGATDMTLRELIVFAPSFLPKLFLKGFAGDVIGQETLYKLNVPDIAVYALGALVIAAYVTAFCVYIKNGMSERTVFPLLLLIQGFINHCLVAYARWIFLNENYLLSSRYAGQFMMGTIGMILIFALYKKPKAVYRKRENEGLRSFVRVFAAFTAFLLIAGNAYTSYDEMKKAPYRKANYEEMAGVIRNHGDYTEEELCSLLEWHKEPELLLNAIEILEENRLNVFSPLNTAGTEDKREDAA